MQRPTHMLHLDGALVARRRDEDAGEGRTSKRTTGPAQRRNSDTRTLVAACPHFAAVIIIILILIFALSVLVTGVY